MSALLDTVESDLWIAVINQALIDATLGLGQFKTKGKRKMKSLGNYLTPAEVCQARTFLSGNGGALKDICDAMGMDFETTQGQLLKVYNECIPLMPEEWRQEI